MFVENVYAPGGMRLCPAVIQVSSVSEAVCVMMQAYSTDGTRSTQPTDSFVLACIQCLAQGGIICCPQKAAGGLGVELVCLRLLVRLCWLIIDSVCALGDTVIHYRKIARYATDGG